MSYVDAAPPTGTAQDLMRVVTRARELEDARAGVGLPDKRESLRRWVEPPARLLGLALAGAVSLLPAEAALAWHDFLYKRLAAPGRVPFDASSPALGRAAALAREARAVTGREPALAALLSHPPVDGETGFLNLELVRHATLALRAARGRPCRPKLLVAVDPFALDTLSLFQESGYAAYMSALHLGFDRQALGRGVPAFGAWPGLPWRLLRVLSGGGETALAVGGGVPSTARVLYAAREWARDARGASRLSPARWSARLRAGALFRRFYDEADRALPRPSRPGLLLEAWLMSAAAGLAGADIEEAAPAALEALDVAPERRAALIGELRRDLARETPRRRRFFRLLFRRVLPRRPIVFLPLAHRLAPPAVETREAWAWLCAEGGRARVASAAAPKNVRMEDVESFADRFVEGNFA